MANGLPYAIAAQIAYPDRQCVAFVGDGGFSMLMAEFATCVKYKLPVKVVVVKNNTLGHDQMGADGLPRQPGVRLRAAADRLRRASPEACGGTGFTSRTRPTAAASSTQALATPGPVVVEAVVDPFEPPMPARVTVEQATKFAESLLRGEPNREKIALTVLSDKVRELV